MIIKYQKQRENPSWSIGLSENKADLDLRAKSNRRLRGRGGASPDLAVRLQTPPPPSFRPRKQRAKEKSWIMEMIVPIIREIVAGHCHLPSHRDIVLVT